MVLTAMLTACYITTGGGGGKDSGGGGGTGTDGTLDVSNWSGTSDQDGYVQIPVEVGSGVRSFQVIPSRDDDYVTVDYIYAPNGNAVFDWEDWWDSNESLTEAIYPYSNMATMNWPIREEDPALTEGTYEVWVAAVDSQGRYDSNMDVSATILQRRDSNFNQGSLHVAIAYAGGLESDTEVSSGVEAAVDYWAQLYDSYGVAMTVEYTTIDIDSDLEAPDRGSPEYKALYSSLSERSVVVIVGELINGDQWLYGQAAGIPGPFAATEISVVAVSWLVNAGSNGVFSEEEIYLFGETMAHEVGHYLGMYHPVESSYNYWDALSDTPECTSMNNCESQMGDNLMFPYPICYSMSNCERQGELTDGQIGIVQRYVGVE